MLSGGGRWKGISFLGGQRYRKNRHITKQWQKYFGEDRALIINDDKPAIRKERSGWTAYGTPFERENR